MDFGKHVRLGVGSCLCVLAFGIATEVMHFGHAPHCRSYRKDVIVCGTVEAIVLEHVHSSEVSTPVFSRGVAAAVGGVGTTHA
jgi:hypothetical protein